MSCIWQNAREYNEDDSDISVLAGILEASLHQDILLLRVSFALLTLG